MAYKTYKGVYYWLSISFGDWFCYYTESAGPDTKYLPGEQFRSLCFWLGSEGE